MLVCLDGLRWAKADLYKLLPGTEADNDRRIRAVLPLWGLKWE